MSLIYFAIMLFIICPIINLAFRLSSVLLVIAFGGRIVRISMGSGMPVISIGKFQIRNLYFTGCGYVYDGLKNPSLFKKILISSAGIILSFLEFIILFLCITNNIIPSTELIRYILAYIALSAVVNILPITIGNTETDGKYIYMLIKHDRLHNLAKDTSHLILYLKQVDDETAYTRSQWQNEHNQLAKIRYENLVMQKCNNLCNLGLFNLVCDTLMNTDLDEFKDSPQVQFHLYNMLLYAMSFTRRIEDGEDVYRRLNDLISVISLNAREKAAVTDTIGTYEFSRGNLDRSQELFEEVLNSESKDIISPSSYYFLSQIYMQRDQIQDAIEILQEASVSEAVPFIAEKIANAKAELGI